MRTSSVVALIVVLAGCTGSTSPSVVGTPVSAVTVGLQPAAVPISHLEPLDSTILVALDPEALDRGGIKSFSLLAARDLIVRVVLPELDEGVTFVDVSLSSAGTPFYTLRTAFSPDPKIVEVDEPGAAHPYDVLHPTGTALLHLDMIVPIAGTDLVRRSRPGTWQVEALVESKRAFELSTSIETTLTM